MNRTTLSKRARTWALLTLSTFLLVPYLSACSGGRSPDAKSKDAKSRDVESGGRNQAAESSSVSTDSPEKEQSTLETDRPYLNRLMPEAQRIQQEYGIPLETTLAIAVHETGWGKFEIGKNNHFGLRCASNDCITLNKNGADIRYETCPDESECFDMFAESLTKLSEGKPGDLSVIYRNGYATSPSWVRRVRRIRRQVRKTLKKAGIETSS